MSASLVGSEMCIRDSSRRPRITPASSPENGLVSMRWVPLCRDPGVSSPGPRRGDGSGHPSPDTRPFM
eukprot:14591951-Alexandrium_andersonii.AAC.1